jgi:CMP-N-acetylneuraminic acid synthetase
MILGMICARGGSKGIPGKNLKRLNGTPLIVHTYYQAMHSALLDKVIISTDSDEIADLFPDFMVYMRPDGLATDTASKWDVFRYIAAQNPEYDILVDLDTGCPLRAPEDITVCVEKLKTGRDEINKKFDVVMTAYPAERNPYCNMVETWGNRAFLTIITDKTFTRRQDVPKVYSLSPSVFAMRREALFKYEHWSLANMGIVKIPRKRAIDIDTQEDWDYVEYLMDAEHARRSKFVGDHFGKMSKAN